jgi:hypothetical protein
MLSRIGHSVALLLTVAWTNWHGQAPQLRIGSSIVARFELEYSGMREPASIPSVFGKSEPYRCQRVRVWSTVGRREAYGVAMRVLSARSTVGRREAYGVAMRVLSAQCVSSLPSLPVLSAQDGRQSLETRDAEAFER